MKTLKRWIAALMVFAMLVTLMPTNIAAVKADSDVTTDAVKLWIKWGDTDYKITASQWENVVKTYKKTYKVSANHRSSVVNQEEYEGVALKDIFTYLKLNTDLVSGSDTVTVRGYNGSAMTKLTADAMFQTKRYAYAAKKDESGEYVKESGEVVFSEEDPIESPIFIKTNDEGENGGRLIVSMAKPGEFCKQYWWSNLFGSETNPLTAATIEIPASAIQKNTSGYSSGTGTAEDPYVISNATELKHLADQVNAGETYEGKHFKLAADIDLTALKDAEGNPISWTPIGGGAKLANGTATNKFMGHFDGNSKTITYMINAEGNFLGLFGYNGGTIENLTVKGNLTGTVASTRSSYDYVGGLCAFNAGTLKRITSHVNITVADVTYSSNYYNTGGIAGVNVGHDGVYSNGKSKAVVEGATGLITESSYHGHMITAQASGGIVGKNFGVIDQCYNTGDLEIKWNGSMSKNGCIAGSQSDTGTEYGYGEIKNCYNTGAITWSGSSSSRGYGGIVCFMSRSSSVTNCYSIGTLQKGYDDWAPICPRYDADKYLINNYSLDTIISCEDCGEGASNAHNGTRKTETELKSDAFITEIGGAFAKDTKNLNSGYPVLKWQNDLDTTITKYEANTTEITIVEGQTFDPSTSDLKIYAVYADGAKELVSPATYVCSKTDAFTLSDNGMTVTVSSGETKVTVKVMVEALILDYIYIAGASYVPKYVYNAGDTFDSNGVKITAYYANKNLTTKTAQITVNQDGVVAEGITISAPESLKENDKTITISYELNGRKASVSFDVFVVDAKTAPSADENGVYKIKTADDLAWMSKQVNYLGNTKLNAVLEADIDATSLSALSIGAQSSESVVLNIVPASEETSLTGEKKITYSFNNSYAGTFDGAGHTIKVKISGTSYVGLFSRLASGAVIKNLTLAGSVTGTGNYVGAIVGNGNGYGEISNCVNHASVTGSNYVGGIVGYNVKSITDCKNTGSIEGKNNVGGILGQGNITISGCENTGDVTGVQYVAGVSGTSNNATIDKCSNSGTIHGTKYAAGITGWGAGSTFKNCYNKGKVETTDGYLAGIVAYKSNYNNLTLTNCYNAGELNCSRTLENPVIGQLVGHAAETASNKNLTITNSYYLAGEGKTSVGSLSDKIECTDESQPKTLAELSELAETLGEAYKNSCGGAVLTYQTAEEHVFGEWTDNTATAVAGGYQTRTCLHCGKTETRFTDASGVEVTEFLIDSIGEVTLESKGMIDAARTLYDLLEEDQKALVDNYNVLTAAEAKYAELKAEADQQAADAAAAKGVETLIDAIGEVTLDSEDAIVRAANAYEALTEDQKALVGNYDALKAAIAKYGELKAEKENEKIPSDGKEDGTDKKPDSSDDKNGTSNNSNGGENTNKKSEDKTGDDSLVFFFAVTAVLSLCAACVLVRKRENN